MWLKVIGWVFVIWGVLSGLTTFAAADSAGFGIGMAAFMAALFGAPGVWLIRKGQRQEATNPSYVCLECHTPGRPKTVVGGSALVEIALWLFFIIPGLIYTLWRSSSSSRKRVADPAGQREC